FFFQAEDGIRDGHVTGVQTCALPISFRRARACAVASSRSTARRLFCSSGSWLGSARRMRSMAARASRGAVPHVGEEPSHSLGPRSEERRVGKGRGGRGWREDVEESGG